MSLIEVADLVKGDAWMRLVSQAYFQLFFDDYFEEIPCRSDLA
jgi:hypothetical protein